VGTLPAVTELAADPQVVANGYIDQMSVDGTSSHFLPVRCRSTNAPDAATGPAHGEHTEHILEELAYDWEEITRLKDAGSCCDRRWLCRSLTLVARRFRPEPATLNPPGLTKETPMPESEPHPPTFPHRAHG